MITALLSRGVARQLSVSLLAFTNLKRGHHLGVVVQQTLEHGPERLRLARLESDVGQSARGEARLPRDHQFVGDDVTHHLQDRATLQVESIDLHSCLASIAANCDMLVGAG